MTTDPHLPDDAKTVRDYSGRRKDRPILWISGRRRRLQQVFSSRLNVDTSTNRITELSETLKHSGIELLDLTNTNPTAAGFVYDRQHISRAISQPAIFQYKPNPRGIDLARQAVMMYYHQHGKMIDSESLFLTSSTSEAYACIFKLLCDPGDTVLVPRPSYPLFEFLAKLESVKLDAYRLTYHPGIGWQIDMEHVKSLTTPRTRAIILVNPNNPTGSYIKPHEIEAITAWCSRQNLAIIADEVFLDYAAASSPSKAASTAGNADVLTFTLSGISKILGLPQLKLGWVQVNGSEKILKAACCRLEMIIDTYLSLSTPVQIALPELMKTRQFFQNQVIARIETNFSCLQKACPPAGIRIFLREGGWYAVIAIQAGISDEDMVCKLLETDHVLIHPGYYYDFYEEDCLVMSLLTQSDIFTEGVRRLVSRFQYRHSEK